MVKNKSGETKAEASQEDVFFKDNRRKGKRVKTDATEKSLVKFDPLQRYLMEISRYRLLTREEEVELATRVREKGDPDAAYTLVTSNLRLVVKIALEFQRVWMQKPARFDPGRQYRSDAGREEIRSI